MEDEMRGALFGDSEPSTPAINSDVQDTVTDVVIVQPGKAARKKAVSKGFTSTLKVTLRVGERVRGWDAPDGAWDRYAELTSCKNEKLQKTAKKI